MEDLTGREFGAYRVVAAVRQGGMAAVYKAYQPAVDRYIALKILSRQFTADSQFLRRFRHEAKVVAQFQHPHIMPVFDFGESDGHAFLAMPFVNGGTLGELMKKEHLSVSAIVRLVGQICEALDYAHQKGVVHRDIKPSNILMLDRQNCLVADFGLARISDEATQLTMTGAVMGTPAYMSPEQAAGQTAETTSDVYSLGIVLYELLTDRVPFVADTPVAVMMGHLTATIPPPRHLKPELSPALETVVLKALARQPGDRFASAMELQASLLSATYGHHAAQHVSAGIGSSAISDAVTTSGDSKTIASDKLPVVHAQPAARSRHKKLLLRTAGGLLVALSTLSILLWQVEHRASRSVPRPLAAPPVQGSDDLSGRAAREPALGPGGESVRRSEPVAAPQLVRVSPPADNRVGETKPVVPPPQDKASSRSEQSRVVVEAGKRDSEQKVTPRDGQTVTVDRASRDTNGDAVRVPAPEASVHVNTDPNSAIVAKVPAETKTEPAPALSAAAITRSNPAGPGRTVRAGLDEVRLFVEHMPPAQRVVIQLFSATDSDIKEGEKKDETKTMQADGPRMLADRFVAKLKDLGGFNEVFLSAGSTAIAADTVMVDGKFVELDPGSRGKRYLGIGAGKSAVAVEGTVKSSDGTVLATFRQRRISVMGIIGGDSLGKLSNDTKSIGDDIAKFISEWAKGKLD